MDYVVFGIGFGATLLVLGLLVRDLGPHVRFRRPTHPDGVFHAEELVARVSWSRFCGALGTVLAIAGIIFILITSICMALMASDDTAGAIMLGSLTLLCVLMALWTWAFFDRFGSYGILPEREDAPAPPDTASPDSASTGSRQSAQQDSGPATDTVPDQEEATTLDTTSSKTSPDKEADDSADTSDTSPTDHSTPDNEPNQRVLPTPEERMESSSAPIDHESLEAELDVPVHSHGRPRRRSDRTMDSGGTPDEIIKDQPDQ